MTRRYFDLHKDYSFAARMTARGHTLICADHIGVGENQLEDEAAAFTPRQAVRVMADALPQFRRAADIGDEFLVGSATPWAVS